MRALQTLGLWLAVTAACAACGDDDGGPIDNPDAAVPIDGSEPCTEDDQCSDGRFCNGEEACLEGQCVFGREVDCNDGIQCTLDSCSDSAGACRHLAPDLDGDGYPDAECLDSDGNPLGDDCDDDNAQRFPGNREVCDPADVDEDCDTSTYGSLDNDGDNFDSARCCNTVSGATMACGDDCDDGRESIHPNAAEICDRLDNDCDGEKDEDATVLQFVDADRDGHGAEGSTAQAVCAGSVGFSPDDDDCDDTRVDRHRAQLEICDGRDNDCDTEMDEEENAVAWYVDDDGDGFGSETEPAITACVPPAGRSLLHTDCNDGNNEINPASPEQCDALDNDCSGVADFEIAINNFEDDDADGSPDFDCEQANVDCDDNDPTTSDGGVEICDGYDNDCDTRIDEDVPNTVWYLDNDGDGYGDTSAPAVVLCAPISGRTPFGGDCDDGKADTHPTAKEICNGADDDCNGIADDGETLRDAGCTGQLARIAGKVFTNGGALSGARISFVHHTGATVSDTVSSSDGSFSAFVPRGTVFVVAEPPTAMADDLVGSAIPVNGPRSDIEILLQARADLDVLAPTALDERGLLIANIKGATHAGGQGVAFDPTLPSVSLVGVTPASGNTLPAYDSQTWVRVDGDPLPFTTIAAVDVAAGAYLLAPIGSACAFTEGNFFGNNAIYVQRWPVLPNVITWVPIDCSSGLTDDGDAGCCQAHGGASCADAEVAACVEALDAGCASTWDETCVRAVELHGCSSCPATSSCFVEHPGGGCDDSSYYSCLAEDYESCTSGPWTSTCVSLVVGCD